MEPNVELTRKRKNDDDDVFLEMQPLHNKRLNTTQTLHHFPTPPPLPNPYAQYTPGPFGNGRLQAPRDCPSPTGMDVDMADAANMWDDGVPRHDANVTSSPPMPCSFASRSPPLGMTLAHYDPVMGGYNVTTLTTVEPTMKFERGRTCAGTNGGHRLEKWGACMI
ncbi:hypothetical protein BC937DRAFT_91493 [Endogone sp. FLAS-F59071]|nr:hypothetical protein BC937DRAFT_91493 [Endogone sp. FLAS-F59071]|eukprot:RUS16210.1 hypothetical protein BC937DRAFT_91493 [Endogone sp. FLAS-F59071]